MNVGTYTRFAFKKSLKHALLEGPIPCFGTSAFGPLTDGKHVCVGPDVYNERKWYAQVQVKDGHIVKVIS